MHDLNGDQVVNTVSIKKIYFIGNWNYQQKAMMEWIALEIITRYIMWN